MDGVTLYPGDAGTPFKAATDDAGADGHVQLFKLAISADGVATLVPATVANGLLVDVSRAVITEVPADPFGSNSSAVVAAGAEGDLSAKLRRLTADLDSVKTAVEVLDNAIAGSEMQVDVVTVPATDETTDAITVKLATDKIMNDLTALTPKFAKANIAASTTDGAIVTAVTSKKIRVLALRVTVGGTATNVTFNSKPAGAGTAISELLAFAANGGSRDPFSPIGHIETASGEGLTATTGAGSTVGIGVIYVEI